MRNHLATWLGLAVAGLMMVPAAAAAQVPGTMPVQGVLTDSGGVPLEGSQTVQFRLYDAESAGTTLHDETQVVVCAGGVFTAYLGTTFTLDMSIFDGQSLWLGVKVAADDEMTPRLEIGSVPYAAFAAETASVPSGSVMFFDLAACPTGWSALTAGQGRVVVGVAPGGAGTTVGTALAAGGTQTINSVASHTHSIDPASQSVTVASESAHTHSVDPAAFTSASESAHTHAGTTNTGYADVSIDLSHGNWGTSWVQGAAYNSDANVRQSNAESPMNDSGHTHGFTTGAGSSHIHSINVPATTSSAGSSHTHAATFDMAAFNTASTGSATVDVTMPYLQLLICRKN